MLQSGDRVLCIRGGRGKRRDFGVEAYPVSGRYYTIRDVREFPDGPGVTLHEVINPEMPYPEGHLEAYFATSRFAKIKDFEVDDTAEKSVRKPVTT